MKRTALTWLSLGLLSACGSVTPIGESVEQLGADSGASAMPSDDGDDGEAPSTPQETGMDPTDADDDSAPVEPSPDGTSGDTAVEVPIDIDDDTSSAEDETTSDEPSSGGSSGEEPGDSQTDPTTDETSDPLRCDGIACGEPCPLLEDAFCYADGSCHLIPPDCGSPPEEPACPDSCVFPAVCHLCEDGTCASVTATCNEDGSCGEPTFECTDEAPSCPSTCAVPRICEPCNDGCAEPVVSCNEDGSCGEIQWVCEEDPGEECASDCSVSAICQICPDGSCALPKVSCTMDGECDRVDWECPAPEPMCETAADCLSTFLVACEVCENGESSCPESDCVDGQCVLAFPGCDGEYDPCAGKAEGDSCSLCAPNDPDCFETDEIKSCQNGQCLSQLGDPAK
jgi:hypothetical protein